MKNVEGTKYNTLRKVVAISIPLFAVFFILDIPLFIARVSLFNQQFIALLWSLTTALIFLTLPVSKKFPKNNPKWYDLLFAVLSLIIGLYVLIFYPKILFEISLIKPIEVIFGIIATFLVLESVRRTTNLAIVVIILMFISYAKFGYLLPGILGTGEISWQRLFQQLYLGSDFMLGLPLKIACGIVVGFIIFGMLYLRIGASDYFMNLSYSLMGKVRGGPAKIAIVSSSLFGSISGSAVANVSATGMITIPLMKRTGVPAFYAGAIEAVASTGGQIMPPVMGAAAFVMAEFLGIPYSQVVIVAIIPALLFYFGLFIQVDLQSIKRNLKGLPSEQIPSLKEALSKGWVYLIPLIVLVYALFILFYSAETSALYGVGTTLVISLLRKSTRAFWNWSKISDLLQSISYAMFGIISICAAAGFIVGTAAYTGLGLSFSEIMIHLSGGNLILLVLLTAVASTILGMGMPTTAAYIMLAVLAAPAMISLGIKPIIAHFFVFYFGTLSMITPPVCLSSFAAASIAEVPSGEVAIQAVKLGIGGYIVPFIFLFNPGIVFVNTSIGAIIWSVFFALIIISSVSFAFEGYFLGIGKLKIIERIAFFIGSFLLIMPNSLVRVFVCLILGSIALYKLWRKNGKVSDKGEILND